MALITIYGSSTANGLGDEMGGLSSRFKIRVNTRHEREGGWQHEVNDRASAAEKIERTRNKIFADVAERATYPLGKIAVLQLGAYDSCIDTRIGKHKTDIEVFEERVYEVGQLALAGGYKIFFAGLPPIDDKSGRREVPLKHELYTERSRENYEDVSRQAAQKFGADFIEVFNPCLRAGTRLLGDLLSRDRVHPATLAHHAMFQVIADRVIPVADKMNDEQFNTSPESLPAVT